MSKQSFFVRFLIPIIPILMFGLLSQLLGQSGNNELSEAFKNGAFLVDVRTPGEFAGGSVPGAVNIPLDQVSSQISRFKGKKGVVVFCKSGMRSGQAKGILDQNGIPQVINGGTWQNVNKVVGDQ
ncbi:MAG: rhodanese-like domain-containing protein [Bacteroidetes bacterium]|nr:rhodanese-like domain-containing protein [Bacteroidota bacterium]